MGITAILDGKTKRKKHKVFRQISQDITTLPSSQVPDTFVYGKL